MRAEQAQEMDAMQAASNVYTRIMENDQVRVLKVVFKPGDKAAMHHHPDHVVYVVKGGKLNLTSPSGERQSLDLGAGQAVFLDAQSHEATNVGNTEAELIVVEIK
jgi:quercetin dioxygenase-like cupin family protein